MSWFVAALVILIVLFLLRDILKWVFIVALFAIAGLWGLICSPFRFANRRIRRAWRRSEPSVFFAKIFTFLVAVAVVVKIVHMLLVK